MNNYTEIAKQLAFVRNQVCPRTAYTTNGSKTDILTIISSHEDQQQVEQLKSCVLDIREFSSITEQSSIETTETITLFIENKDIPLCVTVARTFLEKSCPLVWILTRSSTHQLDTDMDIKQIGDFRLISMYKQKRSMQIMGDNAQPPVRARNHFKYLWTKSCFRITGKQRVLQRIADKECSTRYSIRDWEQFITSWIEDGLDDADIYSNIRKYTLGATVEEDLRLGTNGDIHSLSDNKGRNDYMVEKIMKCIPYRRGEGIKYIKSYLDYGCAEGGITADMSKRLNLPKDKVFGADVRSIPGDGFTFIQLNSENDECPPLPRSILPQISDASISLITCSMVMHHVQHPLQTFQELRRVIHPNGYLIVREHHCDNSEMATVLDIVHGLYSLSWSTPIEWPNFIDEYRARYLSQTELDEIAYRAGFLRVTTHQPNYHKVKSYMRPDGKITNITQAYYAIYTPIH